MVEFTALLEDTLNVKLRYEEIIKRILQNENCKNGDKKLTVRKIIKETPIDPSIQLLITMPPAEPIESTYIKKTPVKQRKTSVSPCRLP